MIGLTPEQEHMAMMQDSPSYRVDAAVFYQRMRDLEPQATPPEALIPKWIPVGERLPEARYGVGVGHPAIISDNVLVCMEGDVSVANYDQEEKIWTSQEGGVWCGLEPTHWMPLPEAPVSPLVMPTEKK